jgi:hypothetical protein
MGEIHNAGKTAKKVFETALKEFKGSLTADWVEVSNGDYDEYSQSFIGSTETPRHISIDAVIQTDKIQFIYHKYGVDELTDIIAMVRTSQIVPPQMAIYTKLGDLKPYSLHNVYFEGNYGTDPLGNQLYAFKILHLRI